MPKKILKEDSDSESSESSKVKHKIVECRRKNCYNEAKYNEKCETKPRYCKKHKRDDDVLIFEMNKKIDDNKSNNSKNSDKNDNGKDDNKFNALDLKVGLAEEIEENFEQNDEIDNSDDNGDNEISNAGKRWTPEDVKQLEKLMKTKKDSEISKVLGRTEYSIRCKKECLAFGLLETKTIKEVTELTRFSEDEVNVIKSKFEYRLKNKKPKAEKKNVDKKNVNKKNVDKKNEKEHTNVTESIKLVEKINELIDKNMAHFKLTGKCIVDEKVINKLLSDVQK